MMENTLRWADLVTEIVPPMGIEPLVVLAIIWMESKGNPDEFHHISLATGLMQVIPQEAGGRFEDRPTIEQLRNPRTNIEWGARILQDYLNRKGSLYEALYHYSGGPVWASPRRFTNVYWVPFQRAKAHLQRKLKAREEQNGRLRVQHRNFPRRLEQPGR